LPPERVDAIIAMVDDLENLENVALLAAMLAP